MGDYRDDYNGEQPVYTSRLEKYHSKHASKHESGPKDDGLHIDLDYNPHKNMQDMGYDNVEPEYYYDRDDDYVPHGRSSKDADLNIQKLIDLDEGYYTNRYRKHSEKKMSKTAKAWLIAILCIAIAITLVLVFVVEIVSIEGQSMEPTLYGGEKIVAEKISRYFEFPDKGQVVVTKYDGYDGYYVKRIIALPGEWVEIYDNTVYVNGDEIEEKYVNPDVVYEDMELTQVPAGCVFLMGDNRAQSLDSRMDSIGPVKADNLVGNAWCVILPFGNVRFIH